MFKGPQGMSLAGNAAAASAAAASAAAASAAAAADAAFASAAADTLAAVTAAASAAVAAAATSADTAASADKTKMCALLSCNLLWGQWEVPKKPWQLFSNIHLAPENNKNLKMVSSGQIGL